VIFASVALAVIGTAMLIFECLYLKARRRIKYLESQLELLSTIEKVINPNTSGKGND
jgi:hypothetical protein